MLLVIQMKILEDLKITPNNYSLYEQAFTHSSYSNEMKDHNDYERLEFLGDTIVDMVISEYLMNNATLDEGQMTKIRARYVCENALYEYSKSLNFSDYLKVGHGFTDHNNKTVLADVFEAFTAALYLDQGFETTKKFLLDVIIPYMANNKYHFFIDYKSALQELVQTTQKSVEYDIISCDGPAHNRKFTCVVKVNGIILGKGIASSKKEAEQEAACAALKKQAKF